MQLPQDSIIPYTQIVDLADKCATKPKVVLFDDLDHFRFFIFKNLVEPIDEFLVGLDQDPKFESMILTRFEEHCHDERDCFGQRDENTTQKIRSAFTVQTLLSKTPNVRMK